MHSVGVVLGVQLCKFGRDMIVAGTRSVFTFILSAVPVCLECSAGNCICGRDVGSERVQFVIERK